MLFAFRDDAKVIIIAASTVDDFEEFTAAVLAGKFDGIDLGEPDPMEYLTGTTYDGIATDPIVAKFASADQEEAFCEENALLVVSRNDAMRRISQMTRRQSGSRLAEMDTRTIEEIHGLDKEDMWATRNEDDAADDERARREYRAAKESGAFGRESFGPRENIGDISITGADLFDSNGKVTGSMQGFKGQAVTNDDADDHGVETVGSAIYEIASDNLEGVEAAFKFSKIDFARCETIDGGVKVELTEAESIDLIDCMHIRKVGHTIKLHSEQKGNGINARKSRFFADHTSIREALGLQEDEVVPGEFIYHVRPSLDGAICHVAITAQRHFDIHRSAAPVHITDVLEDFLPSGFNETAEGMFTFNRGSSRKARQLLGDAGLRGSRDFDEIITGAKLEGGYLDTGIEQGEAAAAQFVYSIVEGHQPPRVVIAPQAYYVDGGDLDIPILPILSGLIPDAWVEASNMMFEANDMTPRDLRDFMHSAGFVSMDDFSTYVGEVYEAGAPVAKEATRWVRRSDAIAMCAKFQEETGGTVDFSALTNRVLADEIKLAGLITEPFQVIEDHDATGDDSRISGASVAGRFFRLNVEDTGLAAVRIIFMSGGIDISKAATDSRDTDDGCWIAFVKQADADGAQQMLEASGFRASVEAVDEQGEAVMKASYKIISGTPEEIEDPRPWNDRAEQFHSMPNDERERLEKNIRGKEFAFAGKFINGQGCVIEVTPISYFRAHEKSWDGELDILHLLPPATRRLGPSTFVNKSLSWDKFDMLMSKAGFFEDMFFHLYLINR